MFNNKYQVSNIDLQKGQSILEVIIAMAIFSLIAIVMVSLVTGSFLGLIQGGKHTEAEFLSQEGIEAVRSLKDSDWDLISGYTATGIEVSGSNWTMKGEGTNDAINDFVRTIYFNDVYRDDNYEIVSSAAVGALLDVRTKEVKSEVVWSPRGTITNIVNQISYLTNWEDVNEATCLRISTSTSCFNRRALEGITFENTCSNDIIIIGTTPVWDNANQITWIQIDGQTDWRNACNWGCAPTGAQDSDTFLHFGDRSATIPANSTVIVDKYEWGTNMVGSIISLSLKLEDLTNTSTLSFAPYDCNNPPVEPPAMTCAEYCQTLTYTTGTCRPNPGACGRNGETYEAIGDTYCTGGGGSDTCCCAP